MTLDISMEKELFEPVRLCSANGCLNPDAIGWSRRHIFDCNLSGRWLRKKRWNYWAFMSNDCLLSVTVSNLDYVGMATLYLYDFNTHSFREKTFLTPFGRGCSLPQTVGQAVHFSHSKVNISMESGNGCTLIKVNCSDFDGEDLSADLHVIYPENYDTLNVVIPWDRNTFQFTSKHAGMSASGSVNTGSTHYSLNPTSSFACLDFGRGVWPRKVDWNWATISGNAGGKKIGINLGARWTDHTGMTENAVIVDGVLEKFSEDVIFEYDRNNYMKDWIIHSQTSDHINLTFHPEYERIARNNTFLVRSQLHQMIGSISGTIKFLSSDPITEYNVIELNGLVGCVEDHHAVW